MADRTVEPRVRQLAVERNGNPALALATPPIVRPTREEPRLHEDFKTDEYFRS